MDGVVADAQTPAPLMPPADLAIFGFAGQSNMAGPVPAMSDNVKTRHPGRVFLLTFGDRWFEGFEPAHTTESAYGGSAYPETWKAGYRSGRSPCIAFADKWADLNPQTRIGIVPLAVTGRRLRAFMPANRASSLFVASKRRLNSARRHGTIRGMIFSQGESDGRDLDDASQWANRFNILVQQWREEFGADLPVVLVKIGLNAGRSDLPYWDLVREQQELAAATIPNVILVRSDNFEKRPDRVHFTEHAYIAKGEAMALSLHAAMEPEKAKPSHRQTDGGRPDKSGNRSGPEAQVEAVLSALRRQDDGAAVAALERIARAPLRLEHNLDAIESGFAEAGKSDLLIDYLLSPRAPTFARLVLAAKAGILARRAGRFGDFEARVREEARRPGIMRFHQFDYFKRLKVRLGPECDEPLLALLFALKYAGLSHLQRGSELFANARVLASRVDVHAQLLDFLFQQSRYDERERGAWETELRTAFAIEHLLRDGALPSQEIEPLIDPAALANVLAALKSADGGTVLLVHAGFFDALLSTDIIDRTLTNTIYLGGGTEKSGPNWIGLHIDRRAALFAALKALLQKKLVFMTPDGQQGTADFTINVLGKPMPVGEGAAFLAYEASCATMFLCVKRDDERFIPSLTPGPRREPGESFADFRVRLFTFHEAMVNALFSGDPRNLTFAMRWPKVFRGPSVPSPAT